MIKSFSLKGIFTALCLLMFSLAEADSSQQMETEITSLNYISPMELVESLSPSRDSFGLYSLSIDSSLVTLRPNGDKSFLFD